MLFRYPNWQKRPTFPGKKAPQGKYSAFVPAPGRPRLIGRSGLVIGKLAGVKQLEKVAPPRWPTLLQRFVDYSQLFFSPMNTSFITQII